MPETARATWELSLVDSAWQGSEYEGRAGWEKTRELGLTDFNPAVSGFHVRRCRRHAAGLGLEVAVELLPFEYAFVKDIDGMLRLLDETGLDGDLPAGRGTTPFDEYFEAILDAGFSGTAAVELESPGDPSRMLAWVSEAYEASARLLEAAGVRRTTS